MPQLNPAPWFFIMLLSWVTLLLIFKMKILFLTPLDNPTTPSHLAHHTTPWNWPWT
uniref:ATP synthase complex subunit 8 n=1 Tax=Scincella vandenburghi TaxID=1167960 RepID=A0A1B1YYU3_9SAUR|nr:ATP synthase F0 subunit 8 [Scincella vandenburghi]ANX10361.1 ATP synthase F0 subunit 8 [Scincella vandenburghi]